jgi:short-subunit dehydrogenase
MKDLSHKKILIVGAAGGIGSAIARRLANAGTFLILADHDTKRLKTIANELSRSKGRFMTNIIDLQNPKEIERLAESLKKNGPKIDWLIHVAGAIGKAESIAQQSPTSITTMWAVNFVSAIYLTKYMSALLRKNGGIVNISSTAGIWPNSRFAIYSASKAALNNFSQATAKDFASTGRSCICICPGPTNTAMRERIAHDAKKHQNPDVVAREIEKIVNGSSTLRNGDVVVIRDNKKKLVSRL